MTAEFTNPSGDGINWLWSMAWANLEVPMIANWGSYGGGNDDETIMGFDFEYDYEHGWIWVDRDLDTL